MNKYVYLIAASIAVISTGSKVAAQAPVLNETKPDNSSGVLLWQGFTTGMDAESVAALLRGLPEIKSAEYKQKNGRYPEIKIKYQSGGFEIFGFRFKIDFMIDQTGLKQIDLRTGGVCAGQAFESALSDLAKGLGSRYPRSLKLVDSYGAEVKDKMGFTDDVTQVQMDVDGSIPPSEFSVARANLEASLAEAQGSYDAFSKRSAATQLAMTRSIAISACPRSEGEQRNVTLIYTSRAEKIDNQNRAEQIKNEKLLQDKKKL